MDDVYGDLVAAYAASKESSSQVRNEEAQNIRSDGTLTDQVRDQKLREVHESYAQQLKDNKEYFEEAKGEYNLGVSLSKYDLIRRGKDYGFDPEYGHPSPKVEESTSPAQEPASSSKEPVLPVENVSSKRKLSDTDQDSSGEPSSSRFKQDSSDVVQTDFNS